MIDRILKQLDRPDLPRNEPWRWLGNKGQKIKIDGKVRRVHRVLWEHCRGPVLPGRRVVRTGGDPDDVNVFQNFTTFMHAERDILTQYETDVCELLTEDIRPQTWADIENHIDGDIVMELPDESLRLVLNSCGLLHLNPR